MKARVMVAGLATAGLLALTGCGGSPQVAVYVGDTEVQQSQVDAISRVLAETSSDAYDTAGSFGATVMQIMVQATLARQVAADKNIQVTDDQRKTIYAQNELYATLLANPASHDFMQTYADTAIILSDANAQTAYKDLVTKTPIRVNPRFGTWDQAAGGLKEGSSGSLSEAAPIKQG